MSQPDFQYTTTGTPATMSTSTTILGALPALEPTILAALPSPLRPYAKALVLAIPTLLTAFAVLTRGTISAASVIAFLIAVLSVAGVYFVPLVPGRWVSAAKTGVAALGAVLTAGVAVLGNGGAAGWMAFGSAALGAVLVEIVDNVPNAAPVVRGIGAAVQTVAADVAQVPTPAADGA